MIRAGGPGPTDPGRAGERAQKVLSLQEQIAAESEWLISVAGLVESIIADDGVTMGTTALTKPRLNFVLSAVHDGLKRSADRLVGIGLAVASKRKIRRRSPAAK